MTEAADYRIGVAVTCRDGECGELRRVLVDSDKEAVSHLAVVPKHHKSTGRLVPVHLVESATSQEIRLTCTLSQFESLDPAEDVETRTELHVDLESRAAGVQAMRRLGPDALEPDGLGGPPGDRGMVPERRGFEEDNIPDGEGEVSQGQPVHASDGPVGHVAGLVADPSDDKLRYILVEEGHLWGEREVAIPVSAVRFVVDDGVHLDLTKHEVGALPPLDPHGIE